MSAIEDIREAVGAGNLVMITGAGISAGLTSPDSRAPDWQSLILSGLNYAHQRGRVTSEQLTRWESSVHSSDIDELLTAAEFMGRKLEAPDGVTYARWMESTFKRLVVQAGPLEAAIKKVSLTTPIATLNFDTILELATGQPTINYRDSSRVLSWARREQHGIFHIHGVWTEPSSCIVGIRDYENALRNEMRLLLQQALTSFRRLVFVGCGETFRDPNFTSLIAWTKTQLKASGLQHYALVREGEVAERLADPAWRDFLEPLSYGPSFEDLPLYLEQNLSAPGSKIAARRSGTKRMRAGDAVTIQNYRDYLIRDCGQMTIEGIRADMETTQRKFDLERLFVPLSVQQLSLDSVSTTPARGPGLQRWQQEHGDSVPFGAALAAEKRIALLALPGGGKTILLKRLAVAYAQQARREASNDNLPNLDLLPILIKCREWKDHIRKPIPAIIQSFDNVLGQPGLKGLWPAIQTRLRNGKLLLLIDGLDEIHDDGDRAVLAEHIEEFLADYSNIRLVVTSREAGFSLIAPCLYRFCSRWKISPLDDAAISTLSTQWHMLMGGDSSVSLDEANAVTSVLLRSDSLRRLAENPLLLTMLLVVKHGAGRLPPDRVNLYDRAVEVLLDTWNIKGHEALNIREAVPQLACVAFEWMREGRQTATEKDLIDLLEEARVNIPQISRYAKDSPHRFLKRVELRSSLLVEAGHLLEHSRVIPFYQFRHLTFQEYLAAVAATEGHYIGYKRGASLLDALGPHLDADEWKEVIPMAAVLARKQADPLIARLVEDGEHYRNLPYQKQVPTPVSRLMQCLTEEAEVSPEIVSRAVSLVVYFGYRASSTSESWRALARGPFKDEALRQGLRHYLADVRPDVSRSHVALAVLLVLQHDFAYWVTEGTKVIENLLQSHDRNDLIVGLLSLGGVMYTNHYSKYGNFASNFERLVRPCLQSSDNHLSIAASWYYWLLFDSRDLNPINDNNDTIDRLVDLFFTLPSADIMADALDRALMHPRANWRPRIPARKRRELAKVISKEESWRSQHFRTALLLAYHDGNMLSEPKLLTKMQGIAHPGDTGYAGIIESLGGRLHGDSTVKHVSRPRK